MFWVLLLLRVAALALMFLWAHGVDFPTALLLFTFWLNQTLLSADLTQSINDYRNGGKRQ